MMLKVETYADDEVIAPYATEGLTTIRATADPGGKTVSFLCPACGHRHTHGLAGGAGHRLSHCRQRPDPYGGAYWLEIDDEEAE